MSSTSADRQLLEGIRAGDEAAWRVCIERYEGRLTAYVRRRLQDAAIAEDIVQETFLGFLRAVPNLEQGRSIESLLFAIAGNKLTDVLRRQGRRPELRSADQPEGTFEPVGRARGASSLARSHERRQGEEVVIAECLRQLIAQWKREGAYERLMCCELLLVGGLPNKRVAEKLQISEQAVANHKQFVLSKLKGAVRDAGLGNWSPSTSDGGAHG